MQTFGVVYFQGEFAVSQSSASLLLVVIGIGGLGGVVAGGRVADGLLQRGVVDARILVGAASPLATVALFLTALLVPSLVLAMPLFVLAGAAFAARNPALDAARLDIVHHRLWGRAEAVRTLLRQLTVAIAPLLFGFIADQLCRSSPWRFSSAWLRRNRQRSRSEDRVPDLARDAPGEWDPHPAGSPNVSG